MNLDAVTAESFAGLSDRLFSASNVALELVDVDKPRADKSRRSGVREPFALLFRGPREPLLAQRIHRLENSELGALDIFLVPIGPDDIGQRYEAVFN
ncbi:MAG TPA: hypothetical protein VFA81_04525 [Burkholderiales bacterium]|nr:hypothetical protein [Burkholderiales bacterium]